MRQVAAILCILLAAGCEPAQRDVQLFAADAPPGLLSEWGVFTITGDGLDVNARVTPYELKTPLFSDYALKLRTVWMPAGGWPGLSGSANPRPPSSMLCAPVAVSVKRTISAVPSAERS